MDRMKTLHVFGEVALRQPIFDDLGIRIVCGPDWKIAGDMALPTIGLMGGFEFSLNHDKNVGILSWPRIQLFVGESSCSILIPASPGLSETKQSLRHLNAPWWTLGLCDVLELSVTLHIIEED